MLGKGLAEVCGCGRHNLVLQVIVKLSGDARYVLRLLGLVVEDLVDLLIDHPLRACY